MPSAPPSPLTTLPYYFTTHTVLASAYVYFAPAFGAPLSAFVADVIRAVAALVAVAAAVAHVRYDCRAVIDRFYEKVFPPGTPRGAAVIVDTLAHFGPLLANGPPSDVRAVWVGYGLVVAWYAAVRGRIQALYFDDVPWSDYDRILFGVLPVAAAAFSAALAAA